MDRNGHPSRPLGQAGSDLPPGLQLGHAAGAHQLTPGCFPETLSPAMTFTPRLGTGREVCRLQSPVMHQRWGNNTRVGSPRAHPDLEATQGAHFSSVAADSSLLLTGSSVSYQLPGLLGPSPQARWLKTTETCSLKAMKFKIKVSAGPRSLRRP